MKIIVLLTALSEFVALLLIVRIWRTRLRVLPKVGWSAFVCLPVLGPLAFLWIQSWPPPQDPRLQDRLPSDGSFFHSELSKRRDLDKHNQV
jgi:4-amino-4-deoxy-L-arabinose transferase-like glycosyltransferase